MTNGQVGPCDVQRSTPSRAEQNDALACFELCGAGLWAADAVGRYTLVNAAFAAMLGDDGPEATRERVVNMGQQVYADPADWEACLALAPGTTLARVVPLYGRDGQMLFVREQVTVSGGAGRTRLFGAAMDVTRSMGAKRDLEAHLAMLRQVMDAMADAMVLVDLDGNVALCNRLFATRLGADQDASGEAPLSGWLEPLDPADERHLARLAETPAPYNIILAERATGEMHFTTVTPFTDATGALLGAILLLRESRLLPLGDENGTGRS